ncbi:hypothetical protein KM043_017917 [Ampulex compressa]|nr:hypothetical protein KM043_017917 [Ampulex compressa]
MTNAMGGTNLHVPQSIFQHMIGQQGTSQQPGPWLQVPQVPPPSIPWSVPSLQQAELVRFTGKPRIDSFLRRKRRREPPELLDTWQAKHFITEEKMAAHFKDMHISSNYHAETAMPSTSKLNASSIAHKQLNMDLDLEATNAIDMDQVKSSHPRLILSEEIKRLQQEPILPTTLLSKLERPSMALVLWEPPSKHLRILPTRDTPTPIPGVSDDNNNNTTNNNGEGIPDLNILSSSSSPMPDFEPMEL